jgi:hypothetical protein
VLTYGKLIAVMLNSCGILCCCLHAQVAAYCNGRDTVTEYDCLLLEHVLWQSSEHAPKIADWLLGQLAVDDGMKQVKWSCSHIRKCWAALAAN